MEISAVGQGGTDRHLACPHSPHLPRHMAGFEQKEETSFTFTESDLKLFNRALGMFPQRITVADPEGLGDQKLPKWPR